MSDKLKLFLILFAFLLLFSSAFVLSRFKDRIPSNPEGTVGNTAGNLNNGGYFCERDGKIYFANAYDGNSLYSMNSDQTDIKKLHNGTVSYLNAGQEHLYFYQTGTNSSTDLGNVRSTRGLYRYAISKKKAAGLSRNAAGTLLLINDTLYFQTYTKKDDATIHSIDTSKKNEKTVLEMLVTPTAYYEGTIYFAGTGQDHYLYGYNIETESHTSVYNGNLCYPIVENGYVYYMDISNNYQLCRYDLFGGEETEQVLTTDRIDTFNVYGDMIYYQKNDANEPALVRMNTDGSNPEIVAEGNFTSIHMTSTYTYFQSFGADVPVYQTPTYGGSVTQFEAARTAAYENINQ